MLSNIKLKIALLVVGIAKKMGEHSMAICWGWYHQPQVPETMKTNKKD